jgi:methylglyoxal synthase
MALQMARPEVRLCASARQSRWHPADRGALGIACRPRQNRGAHCADSPRRSRSKLSRRPGLAPRAIRSNALYLPTQRTASYWAAFEGPGSAGAAQQHTAPTRPETETLALVAHDAQKLELCRWAVEHRHRLRRFHSIITTGATGSWVARLLKAANVPERKIDLIERAAFGLYGGDIEIAGEILCGRCQRVVLLVGPDTPHAHEADIRALLRTYSMLDVEVNLRLTERGATSWISFVPPENPG